MPRNKGGSLLRGHWSAIPVNLLPFLIYLFSEAALTLTEICHVAVRFLLPIGRSAVSTKMEVRRGCNHARAFANHDT